MFRNLLLLFCFYLVKFDLKHLICAFYFYLRLNLNALPLTFSLGCTYFRDVKYLKKITIS